MKDVCIISGRYPATTYDSAVNHKIYAETHGYRYIHCNWPTKWKNRYLNKIEYLLHYMDLFDYVIWIDDDAFFFDFDKDIMDYAPEGEQILSICKSPDFKELKTYLSSGQFILKCNEKSKSLLQQMLELTHETVKAWWTEDLGYYTNGDQDLLVYLLRTEEAFKQAYTLHNYKCFNSRFQNLEQVEVHLPLILHFTGKVEVKEADYLMTQRITGRGSSLVPSSLLSQFNTVKGTSNRTNKKWNDTFLKGIKKIFR